MVIAAVEHHVVVQLVAAVVARDERRRIADRAEQAAEGHLRIAHVARVLRHALQAGQRREVDALVRADLAAARVEVAEADFVQPARSERVGVTERDVLALGGDRSSEARDERLVQRARAERLLVVHAEGGEPAVQAVVRAEAMIDPEAELVHRVHLVFDAEEVLDEAGARRQRHLGQERRGDRTEPVRTESGCRQTACTRRRPCASADRRSAASPEKSPLRSAAVGTEKRLRLRLADPLSFVAEEEEGPIALDRTADVDAELVLAERRDPASCGSSK